MNAGPEEITIHIKYKDIEQTFHGTLEVTWLSISRFFNEFLPSFETANRLMLNVDLQGLINDCQGIIGLAKEGSYLLVARDKLTDNETLELLLLARYVDSCLGRSKEDSLSKDELQARLGKESKIASTRLGELAKSEIVKKTLDEKYKLTTFGIVQIQKDILPRIKTKIGINQSSAKQHS